MGTKIRNLTIYPIFGAFEKIKCIFSIALVGNLEK